jgi:hypothetical protein
MRFRLSVFRHGLPPTRVVWATTDEQLEGVFLVSRLLSEINDTVPLEAREWGLEDYVLQLGEYELLHFHNLSDVLREDDHITYASIHHHDTADHSASSVRPLTTPEVRARTLAGRDQVSVNGQHILDGVPWGRPLFRSRDRPEVRIPSRKRAADEMPDDPLPEAERPGELLALTMGLGEEHEQAAPTPDARPMKRRRLVKKVHFDGADGDDEDDESDADFAPMDVDSEDEDPSSDDESSDESSDSSDSSSESPDSSSDSSLSDSSSESSSDSSSDDSDSSDSSDSSLDAIPAPKNSKQIPRKSMPAVGKPIAKAASEHNKAPKAKKSAEPKASDPKKAPETKKVAEPRKAAEPKKASEPKASEPKASKLKKVSEPKKTVEAKKTAGSKKVVETKSVPKTTVQRPEDEADAESQRAVPPGMGTSATKKRNERRKNKHLLLAANAANQALSPEPHSKGDGIDDATLTLTPTPVAAEGTTAGADTSSGDQEPIPRPKLDLSSSRRLVFGALGVSTPKSKADAEKISQRLMQRSLRPSLEHKMPKPEATEASPATVTEGTSLAHEPHHLSTEWKSKIHLLAVDCTNGESITPPPYPFVQQWSKPKNQKGNKWKAEYGAPQSGDSQSSSPSSAVTPNPWKPAGGSAPEPILETDCVPEVPDNMGTLKDARPEDIVRHTVLAFKQLELSAAMQPTVSGYRTALVRSCERPRMDLEIVLARRYIPRPQRQSDWDMFSMPMVDGEEDDGTRMLRFADLIDPKVVEQPEDWGEQQEALREPEAQKVVPVVVDVVGTARDRNTSSPESVRSGSSE